jgi:hypothetical protein
LRTTDGSATVMVSVVSGNCTMIQSEIRVRAQAKHEIASHGVALRVRRNTKGNSYMATVALRTRALVGHLRRRRVHARVVDVVDVLRDHNAPGSNAVVNEFKRRVELQQSVFIRIWCVCVCEC